MRWLRYILVFALCMVFAVPKPVFHFISHIPNIIHHYHHHQERTHAGLFDFLKTHIENPGHDDKEHEHESLPCNHKHTIEVNQLVSTTPQERVGIKIRYFEFADVVKAVAKQQHYEFQYLKFIWQPPRA